MIHGLDTGFLVAAEVAEHADHRAARETLARLTAAGDQFALAPQLLAEFIHIVTDPRRFTRPLDVVTARNVAEQWWTARDAVQVFPDDDATRQFLLWLQQFSLGRKRLLDTLLAATYRRAGIQSLLTTDPGDFGILPSSRASRRKRRPPSHDDPPRSHCF
jgi:predicted nucleic acid-binding protein